MKKYILALCFTFLCFQFNFSQDGPPPPGGCECCDGKTGTELTTCLSECDLDPEGDYCSEVVPIDSNIIFLIGLAISFGGYSVYQSRRKSISI